MVQIIWLPEAGSTDWHRVATYYENYRDQTKQGRYHLEYRNDWGWHLSPDEIYVRIVYQSRVGAEMKREYTMN